MLIAEFRLQQPILERTRHTVPGVRFEWEQSNQTAGGTIQTYVWAECDDFAALDEVLAVDPTVVDATCTTEAGDRRLYRMNWSGEGHENSTYPTLVEEASLIQRITGDSEGWVFRVAFPSHDAFCRYRAFCKDHDIEFELFRIYEERMAPGGSLDFGLTDKQREMLTLATRRGYFDVPRKVELADLAEEVGISHQAASERLRRAQVTLNRNALGLGVLADAK